MPQQRIGEAPVDLRGEPAALRERKGKRLAQAPLCRRRIVPRKRELREREEILDLEVRVAGAREPGARLLAETFGVLDVSAQVLDDAERIRRDRLAA